jgi:hypothetical protein
MRQLNSDKTVYLGMNAIWQATMNKDDSLMKNIENVSTNVIGTSTPMFASSWVALYVMLRQGLAQQRNDSNSQSHSSNRNRDDLI